MRFLCYFTHGGVPPGRSREILHTVVQKSSESTRPELHRAAGRFQQYEAGRASRGEAGGNAHFPNIRRYDQPAAADRQGKSRGQGNTGQGPGKRGPGRQARCVFYSKALPVPVRPSVAKDLEN